MRKITQLLNTPLIYIQQPTFRSSPHSKQVVVVKALPKNEEIKEEFIVEQQESLPTSDEQIKKDDSDNSIENGLHKKGFLERTVEDKLDILTKLPQSMLRPTCEVKVKGNTYTCIILSHTYDKVSIQLSDNQETIELEKSEILSITIISL